MVKGLHTTVVMLSLFLCSNRSAFAQTHVTKQVYISSQVRGFYEYLPEGYSSGTAKYPLIISIHGRGQLGDGNSKLDLVAKYGIPYVISQNKFPKTFKVKGTDFSFIVLSPQFSATPTNTDINNLLDHAFSTYRVDRTRVYITGMSMGGGATWDYVGASLQNASKIAAIVPVCGATTPTLAKAEKIAAVNLPVWATHNNGDRTVQVANTNTFVDYINSLEPKIPAQKTIFPAVTNGGDDHDAWTRTYDPEFKENGMNIYEWMLQFTLPVAGGPLPVVLGSYGARLTGNNQAVISWTTEDETNNDYFTLEKSFNGTVFSPFAHIPSRYNGSGSISYEQIDGSVSGTVYYRLSQTDKSGVKKYFDVLKVEAEQGGAFQIGQNPVYNGQPVKVSVTDASRGKAILSVIDPQGKLVRNMVFQKNSEKTEFSVSLDGLPKGNYTLHCNTSSSNFSKIIVKL